MIKRRIEQIIRIFLETNLITIERHDTNGELNE